MAFDPDAFLAKEDKKDTDSEPTKGEATKGFDVDAFLKEEPAAKTETVADTGPVAPEGPGLAGAIAPAVTAYGMGPTGFKELGQAVGAGAGPYISAAKEGLGKTMDVYRARPIMAPLIDAAGLATVGFPPIAGGQQALNAYDKFNAAKQGAQAAGQVLSQGAPAETPVKGLPTTATKGPYMEMQKSGIAPEVSKKISALYNEGGGNNAVRSWLASAEGQAAQASNPQFAQAAQKFVSATPTYGQQAMKVVTPFLKGAARVAGPAGMAANLYEAQPYLAEAGPQLSSGQAQGRMAQAQQMAINRPTPAPLSPQEASNLLASGDERTINIYGGRGRLNEIVKTGIRQLAAQRVLGPVAPGQ